MLQLKHIPIRRSIKSCHRLLTSFNSSTCRSGIAQPSSSSVSSMISARALHSSHTLSIEQQDRVKGSPWLAALQNAAESTHPSATSIENAGSTGSIVRTGKDIYYVSGIPSASAGSLVYFRRNGKNIMRGLVLSLNSNVAAVLPEDSSKVQQGDQCVHYGDTPTFPTAPNGELAGQILTAWGEVLTISTKPQTSNALVSPLTSSANSDTPILPISQEKLSALPRQSSLSPAPVSLNIRDSPSHFMSSGFKQIDYFHSIVRGLRLGIVGQRTCGKSTLCVDILSSIISNHRDLPERERVYGIYVCIGKPEAEIARIRDRFAAYKILDQITMVCATDHHGALDQYLVPHAACTLADSYRDAGKHVIIVYDDLVQHGGVVTDINNAVGYPFMPASYTQARLLERTAALMPRRLPNGETVTGSSTALCIIDTPRPPHTADIAEQLVGFVDHCIFADPSLAAVKVWPALNPGSAATRQSGRFSSELFRSLSKELLSDVRQSESKSTAFAWQRQLKVEEEDDDVAVTLFNTKLKLLFAQTAPMSLADELITLVAATNNMLVDVNARTIQNFEPALHNYIKQNYTQLYRTLQKECRNGNGRLSIVTLEILRTAIKTFSSSWRNKYGLDLD